MSHQPVHSQLNPPSCRAASCTEVFSAHIELSHYAALLVLALAQRHEELLLLHTDYSGSSWHLRDIQLHQSRLPQYNGINDGTVCPLQALIILPSLHILLRCAVPSCTLSPVLSADVVSLLHSLLSSFIMYNLHDLTHGGMQADSTAG